MATKRLFAFTLSILLSALAFSQVPGAFTYQSVIRDSSGNVLANEASLPVRFKILDGSDSVYVETHTASTNQFGLLTLSVGQGTPVMGTFSAIDWKSGNYSLKVEIDFGSGYENMGTNTLLTVPFAMVAGASLDNYWKASGNDIFYVAGKVGIGTSSPSYRLHVAEALNDTLTAGVGMGFLGGSNAVGLYSGLLTGISGTDGVNRAIEANSNGVSTGTNQGIGGFASNADINQGITGVANVANTNLTGFNVGTQGIAANSEYSNVAVAGYAQNGTTTDGTSYGLVGIASSNSTNGENYGVYGFASGAFANYAGYFDGDVTVTGIFSNPSDITLKTSVQEIKSALSVIDRLSPISYYFDKEKGRSLNLSDRLQFGFSAQEMEKVVPELVTHQVAPGSSAWAPDEKGKLKKEFEPPFEYKGINYIGLIPILTKGIKEQQELIEKLLEITHQQEQRLNALENR